MRFNKKTVLIVAITALLIGCNTAEKRSASEPSQHLGLSVTVHADAVDFDQQNGMVYYQNKPFTGIVITKYANDSLATSIDIVDGKREGHYQKWFPDGKLSYQASYSKGKQEGTAYSWWRNGHLRSESNFIKGVPNGTQFQYYKSGAMFKRLQLVNGKEEGMQQSWRENGKIYNNYEAKNGRIFGLKRSKLCYTLDDEEVQYK